MACGCPGRGLAALSAAARKAAPTPAHLTPAHVDVLQLSLLARNFAAALPLLEEDIFEVVPAATGVVPRDFLLYCYSGGACLCAVKRFGAAVDLFMQALAAPALALNAIQLACYKKMARAPPSQSDGCLPATFQTKPPRLDSHARRRCWRRCCQPAPCPRCPSSPPPPSAATSRHGPPLASETSCAF